MNKEERDAVIEECASVCVAEFNLRKERMDNPDLNFGDPMIQGHKSVTAIMLAKAIRNLKSTAI